MNRPALAQKVLDRLYRLFPPLRFVVLGRLQRLVTAPPFAPMPFVYLQIQDSERAAIGFTYCQREMAVETVALPATYASEIVARRAAEVELGRVMRDHDRACSRHTSHRRAYVRCQDLLCRYALVVEEPIRRFELRVVFRGPWERRLRIDAD